MLTYMQNVHKYKEPQLGLIRTAVPFIFHDFMLASCLHVIIKIIYSSNITPRANTGVHC